MTHRQTDRHQTFGRCFGPLRRSYGCNFPKFPVPKPNCNCICTEPVLAPDRMAIYELNLLWHVFRSSANQHPAVRSPCGVRKLQNTCGPQIFSELRSGYPELRSGYPYYEQHFSNERPCIAFPEVLDTRNDLSRQFRVTLKV